MNHAGRILVWFYERRVILNLRRIEHDHVSIKALLQLTATIDAHILCRECSQFTYGFLQRDDLLIANEFSQHTGKAAVGAWVRVAVEEYTFCRQRRRI